MAAEEKKISERSCYKLRMENSGLGNENMFDAAGNRQFFADRSTAIPTKRPYKGGTRRHNYAQSFVTHITSGNRIPKLNFKVVRLATKSRNLSNDGN
jgi:hypothetical protein